MQQKNKKKNCDFFFAGVCIHILSQRVNISYNAQNSAINVPKLHTSTAPGMKEKL